MNLEKINGAIRNCLDRCYQSESVLTGLAASIAELQADPAWSDTEVALIETTVRRLASDILSRQNDSVTFVWDASAGSTDVAAAHPQHAAARETAG